MNGPFLAIDWGTSNRRAYRIDAAGGIAAVERDDRGILAMASGAFAAEAAGIRARLGDLPMLCAGMVGSNRGWAEAPYISCPATFDALAAALTEIEPGRTAIVPGVAVQEGGRSDVMRGEEVPLLGAVHAGLAPPEGLLCKPGTHCKWARIAGGAIVDFTTAMTGELFALLRRHSLLRDQLAGDAAPDADFLRGVADSARRDLLADLFGVRARFVSGRSAGVDASYVSGLLIGSDVRARIGDGQRVHLLADPPLGPLYAAAIGHSGGTIVPIGSETAFVAGITEVYRRWQ